MTHTNMKNKKIRTEINKLVEQSFKDGKADNAFITKVTSSLKKLNLTESMISLNLYAKGLKRKIAENTLTVESTISLSQSDLKTILKSLKREVFLIEQKLNPSLLGGLRIKIGDELLDYSLKSKIDQLVKEIKGR